MKTLSIYFWLIIAMLLWGSSWPLAASLSQFIDEHEFIVYRYLSTAICLIPVMVWLKIPFRIDRYNLIIAMLSGVLMVFYTENYFLSTTLGTPGLAGAIVTTLIPITIFVLSSILTRKLISIKQWIALILSSIGVMTTMNIWSYDSSEIFIQNNHYMILAALIWSSMSILSSYSKEVDAITLSFYIYIFTTLFDLLFYYEPTHGSVFQMSGEFWLYLILITIGASTFGTTMFFYCVKHIGVKETSTFNFLVPFFAMGLSFIFLGEEIGLASILGVVITIYGIKTLNNLKFSSLFIDKVSK